MEIITRKKVKKKSKGKKIMNSKEIKKFVMYYERITRNMSQDLNLKAKIIIKIDSKHKLKSIRFN